jgi:dTDP-4-dehydrorhamnose 3,5-epimerase
MAKLVWCGRGSIYDVLVDLRHRVADVRPLGEGFEPDDSEHHHLDGPDGITHRFCVLSELTDVIYKSSRLLRRSGRQRFLDGDPAVGIQWPEGLEFT